MKQLGGNNSRKKEIYKKFFFWFFSFQKKVWQVQGGNQEQKNNDEKTERYSNSEKKIKQRNRTTTKFNREIWKIQKKLSRKLSSFFFSQKYFHKKGRGFKISFLFHSKGIQWFIRNKKLKKKQILSISWKDYIKNYIIWYCLKRTESF